MTQFGEIDGSPSARVDYLVDLCSATGLNTQASTAILAATWTKMIGWIPIGLYATLARQNNATILADPQMAAGYLGMVRELSALAQALNIPLTNLGPLPHCSLG